MKKIKILLIINVLFLLCGFTWKDAVDKYGGILNGNVTCNYNAGSLEAINMWNVKSIAFNFNTAGISVKYNDNNNSKMMLFDSDGKHSWHQGVDENISVPLSYGNFKLENYLDKFSEEYINKSCPNNIYLCGGNGQIEVADDVYDSNNIKCYTYKYDGYAFENESNTNNGNTGNNTNNAGNSSNNTGNNNANKKAISPSDGLECSLASAKSCNHYITTVKKNTPVYLEIGHTKSDEKYLLVSYDNFKNDMISKYESNNKIELTSSNNDSFIITDMEVFNIDESTKSKYPDLQYTYNYDNGTTVVKIYSKNTNVDDGFSQGNTIIQGSDPTNLNTENKPFDIKKISICDPTDESNLLRSFQIIGYIIYIIKIVAPLLLLIFATIDLAKAVISSSEKPNSEVFNKLIKRVIIAVIIFLIPTVLELLLKAVDGVSETVESSYFTKCTDCLLSPFGVCEATGFEIKNQDVPDVNFGTGGSLSGGSQSNSNSNNPGGSGSSSSSTSNSKPIEERILIIPGHSLNINNNDYRGTIKCYAGTNRSNLREGQLTREAANEFQKALTDVGIESDCAFCGSETSFYSESTKGNLDSKYLKYKYAIEFHFNGSTDDGSCGSVKGVAAVRGKQDPACTVTEKALINAIANHTGANNQCQEYSGNHLGDKNYFIKNGKEIAYIELEYWDNPAALTEYKNKESAIMRDLAHIIKTKFYN